MPSQSRPHSVEPRQALGREPILEGRTVRHGEALEKRSLHQGNGVTPSFQLKQAFELVDIHQDRVGRQRDLVADGQQEILSRRFADDPERLVQGMPCRGIRLVSPEHSNQVFARPTTIGRADQVEKEGQVLAPQELTGSFVAVHSHLERPERFERDHSGLPVPAPSIRLSA